MCERRHTNSVRIFSGHRRLSGVADDHNLSPTDVAALDQFHVGVLKQRSGLRGCFRRHVGRCAVVQVVFQRVYPSSTSECALVLLKLARSTEGNYDHILRGDYRY
jgi:hypothetical protein